MNIGEHLLRKYGGRDREDDPGPPPPGSWVVALCIVVIGVPAAIWLVTLAWNEQAAAKALVALVVPSLIVSIFLRDRWGRRVVAFPPDRGSATLTAYALGLVLFILSIGLISVAVHWGWASVRTRRRRYWRWFY
ncbi:MAG: hypothetical protein EBR07_03790 [Planctomycetes bacterium]|nr:hypothetical protein [Planctomycetota bacterium]